MPVTKELDGFAVNVGHRSAMGGGVKPNDANYSDYYKSVLAAAASGGGTNPCPFGCGDDEVDDKGRCHHRVGVSPDGKHYEPEVIRQDGMVVVRPRLAPDKRGRMRPVLEKVDPKRHVLIQVTTSYLVYEDRDPPPEWRGRADPDDVDDTDDDETPEGEE